MNEICVRTDLEADRTDARSHSKLSFGPAACCPDRTLQDGIEPGAPFCNLLAAGRRGNP
jgi:hypothetical protein